MTLEISGGQFDDFKLAKDQWAYANDKLYEVWESKKLWVVGGCMGRMRVIVENGKPLEWIYPLWSAPAPYELVTQEQINKYWRILQAFEKREK